MDDYNALLCSDDSTVANQSMLLMQKFCNPIAILQSILQFYDFTINCIQIPLKLKDT